MTSSAFLISDTNQLTELTRSAYASEDLLQSLLADHPALLREIGGTAGRLLLIQREAPVADVEGGSGRWSLDHLFVDSDGVPVLIEVKRSSDTRLRREVVGQMMDYAANGIAYWPIEALVEAHASTARAAGEDPDTATAAFANGREPDAFWRQVEANLRSGRVRLVFVADIIPRELRRIVEFLNEQMRPAEVLALEIDQYVTENGQRVLMPKVVGKTERAVTAKAVSGQSPVVSVAEWLTSLETRWGANAKAVADRITEWAQQQALDIGVTESGDALSLSIPQAGRKSVWPFFIRLSTGKLETSLQYLQYTPAFESEDQRRSLLERFRAIPLVTITSTKSTGWPSIRLADVERHETWLAWTSIADDIVSLIRA